MEKQFKQILTKKKLLIENPEYSRYSLVNSAGIFMHPKIPNKPHTLVCGNTPEFFDIVNSAKSSKLKLEEGS